MSNKTKSFSFSDVLTELKRLKEGDGYYSVFYYHPTRQYSVTLEGEEPYMREYEKKIAESGKPTDNKISEDVLNKLFREDEKTKKNTDIGTILMKVTLLNAFYRTAIINIHLVPIARYICSLNFDERILSGENNNEPNYELIHDLAYHQCSYFTHQGDTSIMRFRVKTRNGIVNQMNNLYSFATKYCAWHQPDVYPIVDSYAKSMLYQIVNDYEYEDRNKLLEYIDLKKLKERNIIDRARLSKIMLNDYEIYCHVYKGLRTYLAKEKDIKLNLKELDIFLWSYGAYNHIAIKTDNQIFQRKSYLDDGKR